MSAGTSGTRHIPLSRELNDIVTIIANLKHSIIEVDDLFWVYDSIEPEPYLQSKTQFEIIYKTLIDLKRLREALQPFLKKLDGKIMRLQDALLPPSRHHGLASLPNEIFMYILDLVAADLPRPAQRDGCTNNLCCVSRRFRDAVYECPQFWSYWDEEFCQSSRFYTWSARSKSALLSLDIDLGTGGEILKKIMPHKDRFHHLKLFAYTLVEHLKKESPCSTFPNVCSLELRICSHEDYEGLFAEWSFPIAETIRLFDHIAPAGAFPKAISLTLISSDGGLDDDGLYLEKLTGLLRTMPTLRTLDVDVSYITTPSTFQSLAAVELPSVKTLKISNCWNSWFSIGGEERDTLAPLESLGQVIRALKAPNIETLVLGLRFESQDDNEAWFGHAFPDGFEFQALKNLEFSFMCLERKVWKLQFNHLSSRCPHLRTLDIRVFADNVGKFDLGIPFDACDGSLANLRSVRIADMENSQDEIYSWLQSMKVKGARLRSLTIESEDIMNPAAFRPLFPHANIVC